MHLGSWDFNSTGVSGNPAIGDTLEFHARTFTRQGNPGTADSPPTYRVYENQTTTPITTGTMSLIDGPTNALGFYTATLAIDEATGFTPGNTYTIYVEVTNDGVTATGSQQFQVHKAADLRTIDGNGNVGLAAGRVSRENWLVAKQCVVDIATSATDFALTTRGGGTAMDSYPADYFVGFVVAIISPASLEWQTRPITASSPGAGGAADIEVTPGFTATPGLVDQVVLLGRVES